MPVFAQDTSDVPFTDIPQNFNPANPNAATRMLDIRKIDGPFTPKDQFFAMQHNNKPEIDPATYRLKITGMVNKPTELSLADLKKKFPTLLPASRRGSMAVTSESNCRLRSSAFLQSIGRSLSSRSWRASPTRRSPRSRAARKIR